MKNVISFSIKYKDDGYWIYEIENGKYNGFGMYGNYEFGIYKDNNLNSFGVYFYNSYVYEGMFKNSYFNGIGRIVNEDGDIYEGEFFYDYYCGKGKLVKKNGTI